MMSPPIFIAGSAITMAAASFRMLNPGILACIAPMPNVGAVRVDSMMVWVVSVGVTGKLVRYPEPSGIIATSFDVISKSIIVLVGELILKEMLVYFVRSTQPIIMGFDAIKA